VEKIGNPASKSERKKMPEEKKTTATRKYPDVPRVAVGAVILLNGKLLLVKRGHEPAKGQWTLPGGLVELGEKARDAVVREAKEEVGLNIKIDRLLDLVDYIDRDADGTIRYHYLIADFLAFAESGQLQAGSDVESIITVELDDLSSVPMPEITRAFLGKHIEEIFS